MALLHGLELRSMAPLHGHELGSPRLCGGADAVEHTESAEALQQKGALDLVRHERSQRVAAVLRKPSEDGAESRKGRGG